MSHETKAYCLPLIELPLAAANLENYRNLYGLCQSPISSLADVNTVLYTMRHFASYINNPSLEPFLSNFLKEGQQMPEGHFFVQAIKGSLKFSATEVHLNSKERSRYMFVDGGYGFTLNLQPDPKIEPLLLATTSIAPGNLLTAYDELIDFPDVAAPVIIQLQAPHGFSNGNQERKKMADEALGKFRWEHALISLDVSWAESVHLPAIHVLPSAKNRYRYLKGAKQLLKIRYDVSAKRCGFKQEDNGLFTLPLPVPRALPVLPESTNTGTSTTTIV